MTSIEERNPCVRQDDQTNRTTLRRSKRKQTTDRTGIDTDVTGNDVEPTTDTDADAAMLYDQTREMQNDLQTQITPQINLESQRDDPFFAAIIDYLKEGTLPSDKNMAQRVLFQTDDFFIQDDQLWHLARLKNKRLQQISPRLHQLCIPKCFRMKVIQLFMIFQIFCS
jgi:hypothetical protein